MLIELLILKFMATLKRVVWPNFNYLVFLCNLLSHVPQPDFSVVFQVQSFIVKSVG